MYTTPAGVSGLLVHNARRRVGYEYLRVTDLQIQIPFRLVR